MVWETESGKYSPLFYSKIELFFNITNVKEMGRRNKCLLGTNYVAGPMPALHSILEAGMVIPILELTVPMDSSRICSVPQPAILPLFYTVLLSMINKCYKAKLSYIKM